MKYELLTSEYVNDQLRELPGWHVENNAIMKAFKLGDFSEAFAFMTRVAMLAESLDHHPNWSNLYNQVTIQLTTHDAGGVTELDLIMASKIESLLKTQKQ